MIEQYEWFLFTFLPGLTLLGIYGTFGLGKRDFQHWILVKIFIVLMLVTNTITILNFLVTAHVSVQDTPLAFWAALVVAALALANFAFLLVIWNGYRWSVWAFGITSFVLCTLKFVGQVPIFPVLFEFSSVIILIYLLRSPGRRWNSFTCLMTLLISNRMDSRPVSNKLATNSLTLGILGWIFYLLQWCFDLTIGLFLAAVSAGVERHLRNRIGFPAFRALAGRHREPDMWRLDRSSIPALPAAAGQSGVWC